MNTRAAFAPLPSAIRQTSPVRAALLLLFVQAAASPTPTAAQVTQKTVNLDGKTVFIPEVKLAKRVNPVSTFLYIGSWKIKPKEDEIQSPLCALDLKNGLILFESPKKLLGGSNPTVVTQAGLGKFLDGISWGRQQATQLAFKVTASRRQPAVIELYADSGAALFQNGKLAGAVSADSALAAGGRCYLPLMLETGENIINIKQCSDGEPRIEPTICLDHSHDLQAAWQPQNGLLKKLVHAANGRSGIPALDWSRSLGNFTVSLEVRDVSSNKIILQKASARPGRMPVGESQTFPQGIYEAAYRVRAENASEFFIVGNPKDLFAELEGKLSKHDITPQTKLNIEAQLRRARILLADANYDISDRKWQEKLAHTFSCLATFERRLKDGVADIAKDQPGMHIRGFVSGGDGSAQFYRLFVPSNYKPGMSLPLLVIANPTITKTERPFIEGPVMADYRGALLWAKYAEQHGFAVLWPGYRGVPKGYTYESVHIDEAIQAVEKDYTIDNKRISVYGTCGAGYYAGRLVSEYDHLFAAMVYDRAVFDFTPDELPSALPSLVEWLDASSPVPRVLGNPGLKIFVMHDNTRPEGHGPLELTTRFLASAKEARDDVVSYLSKQPMSEASRIAKVFSWLAPCKNENPSDTRSRFLAKAGYTGPIMEIFATPLLVVEGSHAFNDGDRKNLRGIMDSLKSDYRDYFHGAECPVKKDNDVTQEDIETHSLILIGDPLSNSVWGKLQPRLPIVATQDNIMYKNATVAKKSAFEAIAPNPSARDKYILMIGAGDWRNLKPVITNNLFNAWYDCLVFDDNGKIISKLDALPRAQN